MLDAQKEKDHGKLKALQETWWVHAGQQIKSGDLEHCLLRMFEGPPCTPFPSLGLPET